MKHIIIIGHPKREKKTLSIENKEYEISFDEFKSGKHNEDPFIWNDNFLYTFCHTNVSLSKDVREWIETKEEKEEVYFVFVSKAKDENNKEILEIDTIIKAKELYKWPEKGQRNKEILPEIFNPKIKNYHLPDCYDGHLTEHNKKKLYTCIGDETESFLPMKEKGDSFKPYYFDENIANKILSLITVGDNHAYYVAKETSPRLQTDESKKIFKEISKELFDIITNCKQDKTLHLTGKLLKDLDMNHRKK